MQKRSTTNNENLCCFSYSDGRRCRMLRHRDHPGLCPFHSREERQALESERIGTELAATLSGHFLTATDINHVLGKVFTALAQDRISVKKAKALCYAAQLMLATLRYAKQESQIRYGFDAWQRMLKNATQLPDPPDPIDPWDSIADHNSAVDSAASADVGARFSPSPASNVGARFSASPTAAGSASACDDRNVAACPPSLGGPTFRSASGSAAEGGQPLGVGASAPTYKQRGQREHLSSAHPSAPSADACADSSPLERATTTTDHIHEDTTEEPALVGAGSTTRRDT